MRASSEPGSGRRRSRKTTGWRRVASALWRGPSDPQIFGMVEVDASAVQALLARAQAAGAHLTLSALVGRAVAYGLHCVPELNVRLRWGRVVQRPSVDVFFITAVGGGRDLSGVKVEGADRKSAWDISRELQARGERLRGGHDARFSRSKRLMERLPFAFLRPLLRLLAWLTGDLALPLRPLGVEATPFGSAMVSSTGMMGLPVGFSPLAWMYRVPLLIFAGQVVDKPLAVEGRVEVRPVLPLTASIDHRYADGWHIAQLHRALREYLADPAAHEPALADILRAAPAQSLPAARPAGGVPLRILEHLLRAHVAFACRPHPQAFSAQHLAEALHVSGSQVAKSVLVEVDGQRWIAVLAAPQRVDPTALAAALGAQRVRLLAEHEFTPLFPDCEPGAEPPFGSLYGLPVLLEAALTRGEPLLLFRAGSHEEAVALHCEDFVRLERPTVASFAHPTPGRPPQELGRAPEGWPDGSSAGHA